MNLLSDNLLSLVIFLPLLGAAALLLLPRPVSVSAADVHGDIHAHPESMLRRDPRATAVRWTALGATLLTFLASLVLFGRFSPGKEGFQFVEVARWVPAFKIEYRVGLDGISLLLVLLTTFLSVLAVYYSFNVKTRVKEYMIFLLVLESAMIGVFSALDLVLFYVFWEAVLIPMYFLIGIWGHERRIYAAIKFFLYTFAGSILMLVGIVYLYAVTGTFNMAALLDSRDSAHMALLGLDGRTQLLIYGAFALAFMVKVPMFPFHTWLPDAHVEAPTAGSVILAGVLLKMGTYGFLRICLPMFPVQAVETSPLFLLLAVVGIVYGAIVAAVQPDMKKLVAYSSVSHLGFVMLGIYSFTELGLTGAVLQSINHGVSTGMLFFLVGMLYDRRHTREISEYGGIKRVVPVLSAFFLVALLSSIALPLTNGFVGEFAILQGSFLSETSGPAMTAVAASGMVLSAVYMLWLFQRVFTGPVSHQVNRGLSDLDWREKLVLAPLVLMIFWFGCYVSTWTGVLQKPIGRLLVGSATTAGPPDRVMISKASPRSQVSRSPSTELLAERPARAEGR